jgi:hypothetical protein
MVPQSRDSVDHLNEITFAKLLVSWNYLQKADSHIDCIIVYLNSLYK